MPRRYFVESTILGGIQGQKLREDIQTSWEPDEKGILQPRHRAVPVHEAIYREHGEEVRPEEFMHGPEEFARLLAMGAIREEIYEAPEPEPVSRRRAEAA